MTSEGRRDAVRAYYAEGAHEWERLARPDDGAVEFALHTRFLARWLPPHSRVLDLGGGPGRYAIWLAQQGHRVVLGDLSPALVSLAAEKVAEAGVGAAVEEIRELDALDLAPLDDGTFDVVLAMGPFYHLIEAAERERAAGEIRRVLRPGGIVAATVMPRYARLLAVMLERGADGLATAQRILAEGVFEDERAGRFPGAYLYYPQDVAPFFGRHGFRALALLASQGILGLIQTEVARLEQRDAAAYEHLLAMAEATAADPSILGLATHLLYVGRRLGDGLE